MSSLTWSSSLVVVIALCCYFCRTDASIGLVATPQNCTNEGEKVVVKLVEGNPCYECMCQGGQVVCNKEMCPSTEGCYVLLHQNKSAAQCCQVCKGCHYRGVHHPSGSQWTDADDPCQTMTCQGGVVTVARQICRFQTDLPVNDECAQVMPPAKGQCCPRCRGCRWKNETTVAEGETTRPDPDNDPCTQCTCRQGSMVCTKQTCPVLPCPANKARLHPGSCCPVCQGVRKEVPSQALAGQQQQQCLIGRKSFAPGATFRPDPCTDCTCQADATTVCFRDIRRGSPLTCPNLQPSEAKQTGQELSSSLSTASMFQHQPQQLPTALPASRPLTCAYRGVTYQDGAGWSMDPCTQCSCSKGEVRCAVQQCPVYQPKDRRRTKHKMGAHLRSTSKMSTGHFQSVVMSGPNSNNVQPSSSASGPCPPGRHPVKEPGQCCPKCVEDDAVCTVFGDPHYRTFDGRVFNFQGACKYLLTSDCRNDSFSVRVTNDARSSRSFSWTKTVTLTIEDLKVTLGQNMKVKVNHKRVSLPYVSLGVLSVVQEGYSVVVRTNLGVKLLWDGESFLEVTVPPSFKRRLCGLCGNFNGRRRDDLRMRNGQLANSVEQFGSSWKVGGPKSCSTRPPPSDDDDNSAASVQQQPPPSSSSMKHRTSLGKPATRKSSTKSNKKQPAEEPLCQRQWHIRIRAVRECSVLKAATFAQCHSQVSPVRYFKSCLLDMCECPAGKQCYCEALTAYAHECARRGVTTIDPKWRELTACTGHHHQPTTTTVST